MFNHNRHHERRSISVSVATRGVAAVARESDAESARLSTLVSCHSLMRSWTRCRSRDPVAGPYVRSVRRSHAYAVRPSTRTTQHAWTHFISQIPHTHAKKQDNATRDDYVRMSRAMLIDVLYCCLRAVNDFD